MIPSRHDSNTASLWPLFRSFKTNTLLLMCYVPHSCTGQGVWLMACVIHVVTPVLGPSFLSCSLLEVKDGWNSWQVQSVPGADLVVILRTDTSQGLLPSKLDLVWRKPASLLSHSGDILPYLMEPHQQALTSVSPVLFPSGKFSLDQAFAPLLLMPD